MDIILQNNRKTTYETEIHAIALEKNLIFHFLSPIVYQ